MTTIAFDGICFGDGPATGVARAFVTALLAYADRFEDRRCVLLLPHGVDLPRELSGRERVSVEAAPRGRIRRQLLLPRLLHRLDAALLHSSVAAVPLRAACPTIATVHDLPWLHADLDEHVSRWRRTATARSLRAAAHVLAPSTLTHGDARTLLGDSGRITVVPHATPSVARPPAGAPTERRGAFLVLGDDRPRKNRARLREAHAIARRQVHDLPDLEFVGPPDHYVDEATKGERLRACRALVHVSRFEGFGLPVLEGLAHAAPVLCSDLPPHREIAQDAALYVDPEDAQAIADALIAIHDDAALRERLIAAGPARAATYSPQRCAEAWRRVHDEVLG